MELLKRAGATRLSGFPVGKGLDHALSMVLARAALWLALAVLPFLGRAEDFFPTLVIDGKTNTNVRVVRANPAEVVLMYDGGGATLKRKDLPPELQAKYPYDHEAAAEYETQKAAAAKALRERQRAQAYAALLRQESEIQSKLHDVEKQLSALQKELDVLNNSARGKPHSPARQQADRYRMLKLDLTRYAEQLRDQLEQVRANQAQWR